MACVRARPPLTPFLLSRLIVCPQSRERRGELFAEANADYFFVAGATKLITGETSPRDTAEGLILPFPFSSSGFLQRFHRENLTRAVTPVPTTRVVIRVIEGERYVVQRIVCILFFSGIIRLRS